MLMFIACTYFLFWEYDRLRPLLFFQRKIKTQSPKLEFLLLPFLFAMGGVAAASIFAAFGVPIFTNLLHQF